MPWSWQLLHFNRDYAGGGKNESSFQIPLSRPGKATRCRLGSSQFDYQRVVLPVFPHIRPGGARGYTIPCMIDLQPQGLSPIRSVQGRLAPAVLVEYALSRGEARLADQGALVATTGAYTGRAPRDKFLVWDEANQEKIAWGAVNQKVERDLFDRWLDKARRHLQDRDLFVCDGYACADHAYRRTVRVIAEKAWHCLFADRLLLRFGPGEPAEFKPDLTIFHAPDLQFDPERDGTRSEVVIALDLERGLVVIGGTHYAGEIKKSVFTYLNYQMPQQGVFPMHCSANVGLDGKSALLFGLSGTGKTTLSADPARRLIGDDEHGWSDHGIFNFEGGCYAKCINLSAQTEPQIFEAIRFGSVLENVVLDSLTRRPDFSDASLTENTRAAYPIDFIPNAEPTQQAGHPSHILFLTCDAFGVLPPLSRLTPEQALYHFLSGYTAKVAGTEAGVKEPQATFSTCFGAPFLPLHPTRYAEMLHQQLLKHQAQVWLVNTGWTGGPYGQGRRIQLAHTRALVNAVLQNQLFPSAMRADPVFGLLVPESCPQVPPQILLPRATWLEPTEYDKHANHLAALFRKNFTKYGGQTALNLEQVGPKA